MSFLGHVSLMLYCIIEGIKVVRDLILWSVIGLGIVALIVVGAVLVCYGTLYLIARRFGDEGVGWTILIAIFVIGSAVKAFNLDGPPD